MTEEVQTINVNGKEYNLNELSDKAKYITSQIQDMQSQGAQTRARLDQIEVGIQGFTNLLTQELESPNPSEVVE